MEALKAKDVSINRDVFLGLLFDKFGGLQSKLAAKAGVTENIVSRASNGGTIRWDNCRRLADALGVEPELLVDNGKTSQKSRGAHVEREVAPPTEPSFPRIAPVCPPPLVGRADDLTELTRRIERGLPSDGDLAVQVIVPVRGLPGVGKTVLVGTLWYQPGTSRRFRHSLFAALGNVSANRMRTRLLDILHSWGKALELPAVAMAESVTSASDLLRLYLTDKPCLIVLDDVWDRTAACELMVAGGESVTLLTTRDNDVARQLAPAAGDIYTLECLTAAESLDLLERLAGPVVQRFPKECDELVERLEGLPLALQIAGRDLLAALERHDDIPKHIKRIIDLSVLLEREAPADMAAIVNDSSPTVAALLNHSSSRLTTLDRQRFALLGALSAEPATFSLKFLTKLWECSDDETQRTVEILEGRGLLECSGKQRFHLHSLLKAYAQSLAHMESDFFEDRSDANA